MQAKPYYTRLNQLSTGANIDQASSISQPPQSLLEQHNTLKKSVIQLGFQIEDPCQNNLAIKSEFNDLEISHHQHESSEVIPRS